MSSTARTLDMGMQWSWSLNTTDPGTKVTIRLTDTASGMVFAKIELTPDLLASAMSSLYTHVPVEILSEDLMSRVGKQMVHDAIDFPEEFKSVYGEPSPEMVAYAEQAKEDGNWDTVSWGRHNYGWSLHGRRWVAAAAIQGEPSATGDTTTPGFAGYR